MESARKNAVPFADQNSGLKPRPPLLEEPGENAVTNISACRIVFNSLSDNSDGVHQGSANTLSENSTDLRAEVVSNDFASARICRISGSCEVRSRFGARSIADLRGKCRSNELKSKGDGRKLRTSISR